MNKNVYSLEILYSGKYESWEFDDRPKRDDFYKKVVERFAKQEVKQAGNELEDTQIIQLSANNLEFQEEGKYTQDMIYEWFEYDIFNQMLEFINKEYEQA
ncbi:hypothetical protein [Planococcus versutus]|uniref:Uncharacterized protein n=1 Tax=Planococcus versutus TaxID=1302659 RepID=A0A1B1S4U5_9BACL|nr:hypothetical protein [Planococcus versutus]ANU28213.1 hypothetical protein I858_014575 [Planococcus versutus]